MPRNDPCQWVSPVTDTLGRPLRDLRISVVDACNFRCTYCMPKAEGKARSHTRRDERLSVAEIATLGVGFAAAGVRKIRLTGGEPLLRQDLPEIVSCLESIQGIDEVALTTNGALLVQRAASLRRAGLTRVTVSLDTLDPAQFRAITGVDQLHRVIDGIAAANAAGFHRVKVNCVVRRGVNEDQVLPLARAFRGSGNIVRFIEFMDVGTCNGWSRDQVVESSTIRELIHRSYPLVPVAPELPGEVAERYRYQDGNGEIGFISSISRPFCGDCSRARVTCDGQLFTCLFSSAGTPIRTAVRAGPAAVEKRVREIWSGRADRYSELRHHGRQRSSRRLEMFVIGG